MVIYFNQTTIPEGMKATEAGMAFSDKNGIREL